MLALALGTRRRPPLLPFCPSAFRANYRELAPRSAKDKAILEGAYLANPKPDKTARLDIVSQVSLNEKEVQVCCARHGQTARFC